LLSHFKERTHSEGVLEVGAKEDTVKYVTSGTTSIKGLPYIVTVQIFERYT
jgi:hypothetical protein